MDGDAGAVRDVLTGDVLDVAFERVGVGEAGVRFGLELKGALAGLCQLRLFPLERPRFADVAVLVF